MERLVGPGEVPVVLGASLGIGVGGTSCAAADPAASSLPTVFSTDQAKRGRQVYGASCADCHGADLEGVVGPALVGPAFTRRWKPPERSAGDLFYVLRTSMPKLAMGSLTPDDYTAVFAYLLLRNGWPAGRGCSTPRTACSSGFVSTALPLGRAWPGSRRRSSFEARARRPPAPAPARPSLRTPTPPTGSTIPATSSARGTRGSASLLPPTSDTSPSPASFKSAQARPSKRAPSCIAA